MKYKVGDKVRLIKVTEAPGLLKEKHVEYLRSFNYLETIGEFNTVRSIVWAQEGLEEAGRGTGAVSYYGISRPHVDSVDSVAVYEYQLIPENAPLPFPECDNSPIVDVNTILKDL